jgi:G3E family GTPase
MTPLVLITGFLGSGKTTLLRRIARTHTGRHLLFVVNEFAPSDVDGPLLRQDGIEAVSLTGGSIFCKCLVTGFIDQMTRIAAFCATTTPRPEGVVIEASGMSDPRAIHSLLDETRLDRAFTLTRVLAVADPVRLLKLLQTLPATRAQIAAADGVLLNKTDLCPPETADAAETAVRAINPQATVIRTRYCEADIDLFTPSATPGAPGAVNPCRDPAFACETVPVPNPIDLPLLDAALDGVRADIYRIKGFVPAQEGLRYVDFAGGALTCRPAGEGPRELVIIFHGSARRRVEEALVGPLRAGAFDIRFSSRNRRPLRAAYASAPR